MSEYNGWENYPTWNIALWIDNEPALLEDVESLVKDFIDRPDWALGDALKDYVQDLPEVTEVTDHASFVCDLLGWSFGQVNWEEIAKNMRETFAEIN